LKGFQLGASFLSEFLLSFKVRFGVFCVKALIYLRSSLETFDVRLPFYDKMEIEVAWLLMSSWRNQSLSIQCSD